MDYSTYLILPVFLRFCFTKASKPLFVSVKAESATMENGLLCGNERRKRSMVALMDFMDEVHLSFLPRRRAKIEDSYMLHQLMLLYALWFQEYLCCVIRDSLD